MPSEVNPSRSVQIPEDVLARWRTIPVAAIVDVAPECQISPSIRPLCPAGKQPRLFGRAVTALCVPPDFGAVVHAIDVVKTGDVLVIASGGHTAHAMIGRVLGAHLASKGAAGIVCDGAMSDVGHLASIENFSVYTRAITPLGPTSATQGTVNVPVQVGGLTVEPGDWIIGDDDGLASLNPRALETLISAAEAVVQKEAGWIQALSAGQPIHKIFGLK